MSFAYPLLVAAPVIDIDGTLFVQAGIYLALVVILKPILFTPWIETMERRHRAIDGAFEQSKALHSDADALVAEYDQRLDEARERAQSMRGQTRREVEDHQAEQLRQVRHDAERTLDAERERLRQEAERAREALGDRVDELADDIVERVLGRRPV